MISFSIGRSIEDARPAQLSAPDFDAFTARVDGARQPRKGLGYLSAAFSDGHRSQASALPVRFLVIDLDRVDPDILIELRMWLAGFQGCGWPTHNSTLTAPRERAILYLDREASRDELLRVGAAVQAEIEQRFGKAVEVDASTFKAEQPCFLPPTGVALSRYFGEPLAVDEWLQKPMATKATKAPSKGQERADLAAERDPVYLALHTRGMVKGKHRQAGWFNVICPCATDHSTATVDSSTTYMLPMFGGVRYGRFHCLHDHCTGREQQQFLLALGLDPKQVWREHADHDPPKPADSSGDAPKDPIAALSRFFVTKEQVQKMTTTRLIWRDLIAMAHVSVWSAPGNGGKTTLARFAAGELAADGFVVLFFQEDAGAGDLPMLHAHAQRHGYELLNSTLADSNPAEQITTLEDLVRGGADLSSFVLFFDTLKKFADLMSKGGSKAFFTLMRKLTTRGATVVLLGHTNKHVGLDGKLVFEGVGDVRNDVDELVYIEATDKDSQGVVMLTMRPDKVRCMARPATFSLDTKTMSISPQAEVVDVGAVLDRQRQRERDEPVIEAVFTALRAGGLGIEKLVDEVAKQTGRGAKVSRAVIKRYCSERA